MVEAFTQSQNNFDTTDTDESDTYGAVNMANNIPGNHIAILLYYKISVKFIILDFVSQLSRF